MSNVSSVSTSMPAMRANLFSRIDTNADGKVAKEEFVAGRPSDLSAEKAESLFAKIDTEGTGSVTEDQFNRGMEANRPPGPPQEQQASLSSEDLSALLDLLQGGGSARMQAGNGGVAPPGPPPAGAPPSASDRFAAMDADVDGLVSKAEFLAAKPEDVSEEQALALYDRIDSEGTGSFTLSQYEASLPPGGPDAMAEEGESAPDIAGAGDRETALLAKLLEALKSYSANLRSEDEATASLLATA